MKRFFALVPVSLLVLVASCGGGGGSSPAATPSIVVLPLFVVVGDSIAEGCCPASGRLTTRNLTQANQPGQLSYYLERSLLAEVVNQGMSGTTLKHTIDRWGRDVLSDGSAAPDQWNQTPTLKRKADFVYLHAGINDLDQLRTPEQVQVDFKTLIDRAVAGKVPMVVATVGTLSVARWPSGDIRRTNLDAVNGWLKSNYGAGQVANIWIADYDSFFRDPANPAQPDPAWIPDGQHPSAAGYERWSQSLTPIVSSTGVIRAR